MGKENRKNKIEKNKVVKQKKTFRKRMHDLWERIRINAFLMPSLIGVLLFFVVPFGVVVYYSVIDNPIHMEFVGIENFVRVFKNFAFKQAAMNTLKFSFMAVPLAVLLSLLLAILLDESIPMRSQFRTAFLTPMMVPVASVVLIFQVLFHNNGAINRMLAAIGGNPTDWLKSDMAIYVILILFLWKNLGYNMILFLAALNNIPKDIIEVAELESAGPFTIFMRIKLRYLSPTLMFVTIMSLISSFKVFREIYLLSSDHPVDSLYMLQHFMNNTFNSLDYQKLSAAAILMSIVMVVIIGILFITENKFGKDIEE